MKARNLERYATDINNKVIRRSFVVTIRNSVLSLLVLTTLSLSILSSFSESGPLPGFPSVYDVTIRYTEEEDRKWYSILVPSTTTDGLWREAFLFY